MSKFLKFIVHFIVICTIVCVVGLAVPPFLGITTEIMDDSTKETNLPIGSVTYAIPSKTADAKVGDFILYQGDSAVYRYMITETDKENNIFKVVDSSDPSAEVITVEVKDYIPKVVITIGYVGYLLFATESIEGLIILGLAVLFLVILYIIAELCKKEPQDDYEDEDPEPGYVKSKKELKREEKERERRYKEEERQIKKEDKQRKKGKKQERKKVKTGGFVDEIYEDELEPEVKEPSRPQKKQPTAVQTATSEAHELLKKEIAAATAEDHRPARRSAKPAAQTRKAAPKKRAVPEVIEEEAEEPVEIKKLAIPRYSPAQLAAKAKKEGDAPDIVKDEITKVTLFDYSDIFTDDEDDDEDYYEDED